MIKAMTFSRALASATILCVGLSACGRGASEFTSPTGASATRAATTDSAHASLGAYTSSNPAPGGEFTIVATYRDVTGVGRSGVPITCEKEPPATLTVVQDPALGRNIDITS